MSGLLIRSEAVSGWPGLLVDAYYKLPNDVELFGKHGVFQDSCRVHLFYAA
ncbi:MAG: hypothetical protein V7739_17445 [Motiliproteus sp.]